MNGKIDDVRIYSRSLSDEEISAAISPKKRSSKNSGLHV